MEREITKELLERLVENFTDEKKDDIFQADVENLTFIVFLNNKHDRIESVSIEVRDVSNSSYAMTVNPSLHKIMIEIIERWFDVNIDGFKPVKDDFETILDLIMKENIIKSTGILKNVINENALCIPIKEGKFLKIVFSKNKIKYMDLVSNCVSFCNTNDGVNILKTQTAINIIMSVLMA